MKRFRLSIAGLLAGVAGSGVATAALTHPAPLWANGFLTLVLGALAFSALAVAYRSGRRRAFWVGFATCGWAYFFLTWGPAPIADFRTNLLPLAILDILYPYTIPADAAQAARAPAAPPARLARANGDGSIILAGAFGGGIPGPPIVPTTPWQAWTTSDRQVLAARAGSVGTQTSPLSYRRIGQSLFCLLAALGGGFAARRLHQTRDEPAPAA